MVEAATRILTKEEPEVSEIMSVLERSGVDVRAGAAVQKVTEGPTLHLADDHTVTGSRLLVAVGRRPATDGMDLNVAGVEVGRQKQFITDAYLRTTSPHIFAAGDCTTSLQSTHVGDEQGRLAASNAFASSRMLPGIAGGAAKFDDSVIPWVTFTDPEIGRVGLTEQEAFTAYGERARVAVVRLDEMDRPRTAGHGDGYIKLIAGPRKMARSHVLDRIVGFTALTPSGGELAAQVALAMRTDMLAVRVAQAIAPSRSTHSACGSPARPFGEFSGATWRPARGDSGCPGGRSPRHAVRILSASRRRPRS